MEADEEGWVTGKALETVKALKGMRPGDHIKLDLRSGDALGIPPGFHLKPGTLRNDGSGGWAVDFLDVMFGGSNRWYWLIQERQICAWKPQRKSPPGTSS